VEFAGETIFKICEHFLKVTGNKRLTQPLIICKSILLQYLFFCLAADASSHTVGILV